MNSIQTQYSSEPGCGDYPHASVRELIVQLALVEDEYRSATSPDEIAALSLREEAIVAALQRNGLAFHSLYRHSPTPAELRVDSSPDDDRMVP